MPGGFHPPPSVVASWPTPNYNDPETRGYALIVCLAIFLFLALLALAARVWARFVLLGQPGYDDLLAMFAAMPTTGLTVAIALASQKYNYDRHIWDVTPSLRAPMSKNSWVAQLCFILTGTHSHIFSCAVWSAIGAITAYALAFVLILILQCQPLDSYWLRFSPTYTRRYVCNTEEAISLPISGYLSVATDFLTLLLPFWLVWNIKLPKRQKWSLFAIFSLGLIVIMAGIFRSVYLYRMFHSTYDVTWIGYNEWIWTAVENDLALTAACGSTLRPFFIRYLPNSMTPNPTAVSSPKRREWRPNPYVERRSIEDEPSILPIQTREEQELATIESRIGSLINGSIAERSEIDYFGDWRSGTFIASETGSDLTDGRDWPLPGKSY